MNRRFVKHRLKRECSSRRHDNCFAVKVGNSGGVLFVCALNFDPTELYGLLSAAETLLKADEFYTANAAAITLFNSNGKRFSFR